MNTSTIIDFCGSSGTCSRQVILEEWRWHETLSGAPQGGVCSPILSNIYLDKFDTICRNSFDAEVQSRKDAGPTNPAYERLRECHSPCQASRGPASSSRCCESNSENSQAKTHKIPIIADFVTRRYADDWVLGFSGPKAEAEADQMRPLEISCVRPSSWNCPRRKR